MDVACIGNQWHVHFVCYVVMVFRADITRAEMPVGDVTDCATEISSKFEQLHSTTADHPAVFCSHIGRHCDMTLAFGNGMDIVYCSIVDYST